MSIYIMLQEEQGKNIGGEREPGTVFSLGVLVYCPRGRPHKRESFLGRPLSHAQIRHPFTFSIKAASAPFLG